jgi:hypothetical protein
LKLDIASAVKHFGHRGDVSELVAEHEKLHAQVKLGLAAEGRNQRRLRAALRSMAGEAGSQPGINGLGRRDGCGNKDGERKARGGL